MQRTSGFTGFDCHYPYSTVPESVQWLRSMLRVIVDFDSRWHIFGCFVFSIPVASLTASSVEFNAKVTALATSFTSRWDYLHKSLASLMFGDVVCTVGYFLVFGLLQDATTISLFLHCSRQQHPLFLM
jgi:hypothetical protein